MKIVIKVGGSVLCPGKGPDEKFMGNLSDVLKKLSRKHRLFVSVGGGKFARIMIDEEKAVKGDAISENDLHEIGIKASRMNASALAAALGESALSEIPKNEKDVLDAAGKGRIVVMGGFRPGQTTDAVALQVAEAVDADLVIIGTDVKGVYDKDPDRFSDARLFAKISAPELREMVERDGMEPGKNTIVDPVAARLIEKLHKKLIVLDIRSLDNMLDAIEGRKFEGTVVY